MHVIRVDPKALRRNWPRVPLVGAPLAIARLWLKRARKRRSFWKHVAGIVQKNLAETCAICKCRAGQHGRTLAVSLALGGRSDPYAIDHLIAGFEVSKHLLDLASLAPVAGVVPTCNEGRKRPGDALDQAP